MAPYSVHERLGVSGHVGVDEEDPEPRDVLESRDLAVIELDDPAVRADGVVHPRRSPVQDLLGQISQAANLSVVLFRGKGTENE